MAITTKHLVKFIFLRSGKCRLYIPGDHSDGVSLITGRDDLAVLGWSERCVRPRVFVYQYNNPLELRTLRGQATMEYQSLCFSHGKFLLAVSGVPDFIVNLWDWETETLLASVPTQLDGPSSANIKLITTAGEILIIQINYKQKDLSAMIQLHERKYVHKQELEIKPPFLQQRHLK